MEINQGIQLAIKQAKKEGNKGVKGFDSLTNSEINRLINEGKLEAFSQSYTMNGQKMASIILLRKPKSKRLHT